MGGEKTEQPTPKRLRDARKKGQVAKSKEVVSAAVITGLFLYIWVGWDFIIKELSQMILLPTTLYGMEFRQALEILINGIATKMIALILPLVLSAMVLALLANLLQVGVLFTLESVKPDPKKLDPMKGIKKIFSKNNIVELLKSVIKILFLGLLIYKIIQASIGPLLQLPHTGSGAIIPILGELMSKVATYTMVAFILVGAADYFWQKHQHIKGLMMTKDEVKREFKEMEGDPVIKSKRKQLHKEMVMNDTIQRTRKASVLITNPTRLAIALYYNKEETKLPVVLSKGQGYLAKRMVEIAKEEGIPIMQDVPLAQALYEQVDIDHYIPSDLIEPVAEVLRWVQDIKSSHTP